MLDVEHHRSARIPKFENLAVEMLHDRLVAEMRAVYRDDDLPAYLDQTSKEMLAEGRIAFRDMKLDKVRFIQTHRDVHILLWRGSSMTSVFAVALKTAGLDCAKHDIGITVGDATIDQVKSILTEIAEAPPMEICDIAQFVEKSSVSQVR